jgi:hypothetical protein
VKNIPLTEVDKKMRSKEMFLKDLEKLKRKLQSVYNNINLDDIINKLLYYYEAGLISINQSSIQLIISAHLKSLGYRVFVEYETKGRLLDIYAVGESDIGIEVEYGYVPSFNAIVAEEYLKSRLALKILRYSNLCSKFYIAVPSFYIPPIPDELLEDYKDEKSIRKIIRLVRKYHKVNDITSNDVKLAKVDGIVNVNISNLKVNFIDKYTYIRLENLYR